MTNPNQRLAMIGPPASWEMVEVMYQLATGLHSEDKSESIETLALDVRSDHNLLALRGTNVDRYNLGGLAIVNYYEQTDDEMDLSTDNSIQLAGELAVKSNLPIFINRQPTMGGLELSSIGDHEPELIVFGNDLTIIKKRLQVVEVEVGVA
jgi:hypothetical protein